MKKLSREYFADIQCFNLAAAEDLAKCQADLHEQPGNVELGIAEGDSTQRYKLMYNQYMSFLAQKAKVAWC